MKKPTLKQLRTFEKLAFDRITELTGQQPVGYTEWAWEWDTGEYLLTLFCNSERPREFRGQSWLACRQKTKPEWLDADGYRLPRNQCKGWNPYFSMSGKHNLHPNYQDMDNLFRALDQHLLELGI